MHRSQEFCANSIFLFAIRSPIVKTFQPRLLTITLSAVFLGSFLFFGCSKSGDRGRTGPQASSSESAGSDAVNQGEHVQSDTGEEQPPEKSGAGRQASATTSAAEMENETAEDTQKPRDLGPPLVDKPENLVQLYPDMPAWIDKKEKQVILVGAVCRANYPLEFFATYPDRAYESVVVIYTKPSIVHAALLAMGAKPGKPVQFEPRYVPPSGTEVEINVAWKDQNGKLQKARAQDWIRDIRTKKQLDINWVFAGSIFWEDKTTGEKSYLADRGDFISVLNLPTALLDLPIQSASAIESRLFEGYTERLPPPGTPVTMILKPKLEISNTGKKPD
jgi:hypothetical protein